MKRSERRARGVSKVAGELEAASRELAAWQGLAVAAADAVNRERREGKKKMRACVMEKLPKHHDFRAARLEALTPKIAFKPFRMCAYCHAHLEKRHYVGEMIILECPKAPEGFHAITPLSFGGRLPS